MGLLFGCCGQSHWAVFPDSQPAAVLLVPPLGMFHLCFGNGPSLVEAVEEGAPTQPVLCPISAVLLCTQLALPNLYLLQTGLWDPLLYPCKAGSKWGRSCLVRSVHHHQLLWREQEELDLHLRVVFILVEARAAPQPSCCAGAPLSPGRCLWPGCSSHQPGLPLSSLVVQEN